jgi:IrrE N-terminal-like domain
MHVRPDLSFVPDAALEARASQLLQQYAQAYSPVTGFPVPVERIADLLLELDILWEAIPDDPALWTRAYLDPAIRRVGLNETHRAHFDTFFGTYEFTLAHEIGHLLFHLSEAELLPLPFPAEAATEHLGYLCRSQGGTAGARQYDRREVQANRFASCLLLPQDLLRPAVQGVDLTSWVELKRLRALCAVSLEALKIRLQSLGWLYVAPGGALYHSREEAGGQRRLF